MRHNCPHLYAIEPDLSHRRSFLKIKKGPLHRRMVLAPENHQFRPEADTALSARKREGRVFLLRSKKNGDSVDTTTDYRPDTIESCGTPQLRLQLQQAANDEQSQRHNAAAIKPHYLCPLESFLPHPDQKYPSISHPYLYPADCWQQCQCQRQVRVPHNQAECVVNH